MQNKVLETKIRLAYYDASDGPRVMLFGPLDMDFGPLAECFRELGRRTIEIPLDQQPFIASFGGVQILAKSVGKMVDGLRQGTKQGLHRRSISPPCFEWARSMEGWDYLAELIAPIVQNATAGHQYLTRYPGEDAIVVVSKGQYTDDVLK